MKSQNYGLSLQTSAPTTPLVKSDAHHAILTKPFTEQVNIVDNKFNTQVEIGTVQPLSGVSKLSKIGMKSPSLNPSAVATPTTAKKGPNRKIPSSIETQASVTIAAEGSSEVNIEAIQTPLTSRKNTKSVA
jgi:hypothetical protein